MRAARIRGIGKALLEARGVSIGLPPSRGPSLRIGAKHLAKTRTGELHLALGPRRVSARDEVLPFHVVPAMDADLEARIAHTAHDLRAARADVRAGQERSIEQGLDAVVLHHGSAAHLGEEPGAEDP